MIRKPTGLACLVMLLVATGVAAAGHNLTAKGTKLLLDRKPFNLLGVRVPSALYSDDTANRLIAALPEWKSYGVTGVCVFAQGGDMNDADKNESYPAAYGADGSLDPVSPLWMRMDSLFKKCDELGMVVNLGLFCSSRDESLSGDSAVTKAVSDTMQWLKDKGYRNVLIDLADEQGRSAYDAPILKKRSRAGDLLSAAATSAWPGALIGCSSIGREAITHPKATIVFLHDMQSPPRNPTRPAVYNDPGSAVRDWRNDTPVGDWERDDIKKLLGHMSNARHKGAYWFYTSGWKCHWPMHFEVGPEATQPSDHFAFKAMAMDAGIEQPGKVVPKPDEPAASEKSTTKKAKPTANRTGLAGLEAFLQMKGRAPALALAPDGTVHLVFSRTGRAYYSMLPPRDDAKDAPLPAWSSEEATGLRASYDDTARPAVALDSDGRPHVVSGGRYAFRDSRSGKWVPVEGRAGSQHSIAIDEGDRVWIAFRDSPLSVRTCQAGDRALGSPTKILTGARKNIYPSIACGSGAHLVCRVRGLPDNRGYDVGYIRHDGTKWLPIEWPDYHAADSIRNWPKIALLPAGRPIILWADSQLKLSVQATDGTWPKEPEILGKPAKNYCPCISVDGAGNIFVVQTGGSLTYRLDGNWTRNVTLPRPYGADNDDIGVVTCASAGARTFFAWEHGKDDIAVAEYDPTPRITKAKPEQEVRQPEKVIRLKPGERTKEEKRKALDKLME